MFAKEGNGLETTTLQSSAKNVGTVDIVKVLLSRTCVLPPAVTPSGVRRKVNLEAWIYEIRGIGQPLCF